MILLLLIQIVLLVIEAQLEKLIDWDPFPMGGKGAFTFSLGACIMVLFETFAVSLVGAILVVRHGWWSKKLLDHITIWYAVYLVLSLGILIHEGFAWDLWDVYYVVFTIGNCLYPLIVIAIYIAIVAIARRIVGKKNDVVKRTNAE